MAYISLTQIGLFGSCLVLSDEILQKRLATWKPPKPKVTKGYLSIYAKMANTAEKGAALNYRDIER